MPYLQGRRLQIGGFKYYSHLLTVVMVELEQLNEFRFYKLEVHAQDRCTNFVENIYDSEHQRVCNGTLWLNMKAGSVNLRCKHNDCRAEYEMTRICNSCGKQHVFEDTTCDTCEPQVINITTWHVSIAEGHKAIKKINRAFKQDLIPEDEWRSAIKIQTDEIEKCEKSLDRIDQL